MAWKFDKSKGEIVMSGWEKGIAPSPHAGIGDIRGANITSIPGEISVAYSRTQQTYSSISGGTLTGTNTSSTFVSDTAISTGMWAHITASTVTGITNGNYYYITKVTTFTCHLSATFGGSSIAAGSDGSITFSTLNMGAPVDSASEQTTTHDSYRYYVLDDAGVVWVSGAGGTPGAAGALSSTTVWSAISPNGNSTGGHNATGIVVMYATDSTNPNLITASYTMTFADDLNIYYWHNDGTWGAASTFGVALQYGSGFPHKALLGADYVVYYCDGPSVGFFYQTPGQTFDPATSSTYTVSRSAYIMNPTDTSTCLAQLPTGNSLTIVVGTQQNKLYFYPDANSATSSKPSNILYTPEYNTVSLVQVNNFIFVFTGSKGNIYLTNGSSVIPVITVPDYISGAAAHYVQDPYFTWGGASYIRGRVFFSILDHNGSSNSNCGGVWSFVPSFGAFPQQDTGLALRMEAKSSLGSAIPLDNLGVCIITGQDTSAQNADGPQYAVAWSAPIGNANNGIDFSSTTPYTDGFTSVDLDAIPVGTILEKQTYKQIEVKLASALVSGESVAVNYRIDLESAFTTAGTVTYETDKLAGLIDGVAFEKSQLLQLQLVLTSTASSPSYCRVKEVYLR